MINKLECTCIEAYTTRNMRDPNCCACSCDHNELVEQLEKTKEDYKALFSAFQNCHDELVDANERVGKLEKERSNLSAKYKKNVSVIGAFVSELTGKVIILPKMRTKEEIEKSFNKFAIEKKADEFERYASLCEAFRTTPTVEALREHAKQLRKGQNNG